MGKKHQIVGVYLFSRNVINVNMYPLYDHTI